MAIAGIDFMRYHQHRHSNFMRYIPRLCIVAIDEILVPSSNDKLQYISMLFTAVHSRVVTAALVSTWRVIVILSS